MRRVVRRRQRGAVAIVYAMLSVPVLVTAGLAVDLSLAYARHAGMQALADSAAVAAARALDGSAAGVAAAAASARHTAVANAQALDTSAAGWVPAALQLGATPAGPWLAAADVPASDALALRFARVDTAALDDAYGSVPVFFARMLGNTDLAQSAQAVAASPGAFAGLASSGPQRPALPRLELQ